MVIDKELLSQLLKDIEAVRAARAHRAFWRNFDESRDELTMLKPEEEVWHSENFEQAKAARDQAKLVKEAEKCATNQFKNYDEAEEEVVDFSRVQEILEDIVEGFDVDVDSFTDEFINKFVSWSVQLDLEKVVRFDLENFIISLKAEVNDFELTLEIVMELSKQLGYSIKNLPKNFLEKFFKSMISYYTTLPKSRQEYVTMSRGKNCYPIEEVETKLRQLFQFYTERTQRINKLVAAKQDEPTTIQFIEDVCEIAHARYLPSQLKNSSSLLMMGFTANIASASTHLINSFDEHCVIPSFVERNKTINRTEKLLAISRQHSACVIFDACGPFHFDWFRDRSLFVGGDGTFFESLQPGIMAAGRLMYATLARAIDASSLAMSFMLPESIEGGTALLELPHISTWERKNLKFFADHKKINLPGRYQIVDDLWFGCVSRRFR